MVARDRIVVLRGAVAWDGRQVRRGRPISGKFGVVAVEIADSVGGGCVALPFEVGHDGFGGGAVLFGGHDGFVAEDGEFFCVEFGRGFGFGRG